jgi:outer membrane protein assembly factor BamE (lipoprotein component of BamABCDE complex)
VKLVVVKPLKKIIPLLCVLFLSACAQQVREHGWVGRDEDVKVLKVGKSSREDVEARLGAPTIISTFDPRIRYYVGYKTVLPVSFMRPRVENLHGYILIFDHKNVLRTLAALDPSAAQTVVEHAEETAVEKKYSDISLSKVFKNLGQQGSGRKGL